VRTIGKKVRSVKVRGNGSEKLHQGKKWMKEFKKMPAGDDLEERTGEGFPGALKRLKRRTGFFE
jgi:hypothetical protein